MKLPTFIVKGPASRRRWLVTQERATSSPKIYTMSSADKPGNVPTSIGVDAVATALRKQRPILALTLLLYALVQIFYITATPLQTIALPDNLPQLASSNTQVLTGIGPDEKEYLVYIASLAERLQLPKPSPLYRTSPADYVSYQVQHPPLFFLAAALFYRMIVPVLGLGVWWYFIRGVCAVCGAAAIVFAARAAAIAFPERNFVVSAAAPALAFLPIFGDMFGNLSSEPLEILFGSLAWLQMVNLVRDHRTITGRSAALLGLTVALAAVSKLTAVIHFLPAVIAICYAFWSNRAKGKNLSQAVIAFLLPIVAIVGPWFVRNRLLYGVWLPRPYYRPLLADITLLQYLMDSNQPLVIAGMPHRAQITLLRIALWFASTTFTPFWLTKGEVPGGILMGPAWQAVSMLTIVILLLMLFLHASRSSRELGARDIAGRVIVWMAGITVFTAVAGAFQQMVYADWDVMGSAGRYFVAAAPAGTLILVLTLSTSVRNLTTRRQSISAITFAVLMLVFDAYNAVLVRQFYTKNPVQSALQHIDP